MNDQRSPAESKLIMNACIARIVMTPNETNVSRASGRRKWQLFSAR